MAGLTSIVRGRDSGSWLYREAGTHKRKGLYARRVGKGTAARGRRAWKFPRGPGIDDSIVPLIAKAGPQRPQQQLPPLRVALLKGREREAMARGMLAGESLEGTLRRRVDPEGDQEARAHGLRSTWALKAPSCCVQTRSVSASQACNSASGFGLSVKMRTRASNSG